jgi:hypothetical protein
LRYACNETNLIHYLRHHLQQCFFVCPVHFHCSHRLLSSPHNTKSVTHDTSKNCIFLTVGTRNNCIHPALCTNCLTNKCPLKKKHYLSLIFSVTIHRHVSGMLVAHHQEITYICDNWYELCVLVDCQRAGSSGPADSQLKRTCTNCHIYGVTS